MPAHILIVEDNPENLALMTYLLEAFGHTVLRAMDGEEGVQLAASEKPDLILCDLQLPKLDGFEVADRIRNTPRLSHIPVVAVTACAMRGDHEKVLAAGFKGYISKPIAPEAFVRQAEQFLRADLHSGTRPATNVQQQVESEPKRRSTGSSVLALDDRPVNLTLVRSILEPFGYKVFAVQTVEEALTVARREHPNLILSDLHLPEVGGFEFLRAVKEDPELKAIPFILMSSTSSDEGFLAEGMALGAARVLFRPVEPEVLLRGVESCLAERKRG
jgi:two-component system, cell cycle response regulator